jgi:hypothetical protein
MLLIGGGTFVLPRCRAGLNSPLPLRSTSARSLGGSPFLAARR